MFPKSPRSCRPAARNDGGLRALEDCSRGALVTPKRVCLRRTEPPERRLLEFRLECFNLSLQRAERSPREPFKTRGLFVVFLFDIPKRGKCLFFLSGV